MFFVRIVLASAVMAATLYYFVDAGQWGQWSSMDRVIHLLIWIAIGCVIYAATLALTGLRFRHLASRHGSNAFQ